MGTFHVHNANIITVQLLIHHALLATVTHKTTMLRNVQFIIRTLFVLLAVCPEQTTGLLRRTRTSMACDLCCQKIIGGEKGEGGRQVRQCLDLPLFIGHFETFILVSILNTLLRN